jgi:hypothetical protein
MYDISEYISKSTIIKYRDNGLTEKSIHTYSDKRRINLQKIVRMPGQIDFLSLVFSHHVFMDIPNPVWLQMVAQTASLRNVWPSDRINVMAL